MPKKSEIQTEIEQHLHFEDFLRIQKRLTDLRNEEEKKLLVLADLQRAFVGANTDFERDYVKQTVARIRELSKAARAEMRKLKQELLQHLTLDEANDLYDRWQKAD